MKDNIHATVTVTFPFMDIIDQETLDEVYGGDLLECVREMIFTEGICGIIDNYEIVSAVELSQTKEIE